MDIIKIVKEHYKNKGYQKYSYFPGIGTGYLVFDKNTVKFTVCHAYKEDFPENLYVICKLKDL